MLKCVKQYFLLLSSLLVLGLILYWFNTGEKVIFNEQSGSAYVHFEKAKVIDIISEDITKDDTISGLYLGSQEIEVEVLTGEYKGEIHTIKNYLSTLYNVYVEPGSRIIVSVDTASSQLYIVSVYNHYRAPILYGLIFAFITIMGIVGGQKGLKTIAGIIFTVAIIIFLFIPMLYKGYSPIFSSVLIVVLATCVTLFLLNGWSAKTISAIVGTTIGVIIAGVISILSGHFARVTGFNTYEAETLILVARETNMQISGLLFAGILIASLGAIMDIAMSIASSAQEIHSNNRKITNKMLFQSGMNVGRDMMGTSANTLILAFTGTSLNSILVLYSLNVPYHQLMNMDLISIEIIQGIAGSIAIILTIPIVAWISSRLIPVFEKKKQLKLKKTS
ncbi:YibE/F family protein [Alkalihalophilus pseudofirmus]|nr:YibE/F family protein [Alkalihalophilus pseudofirmus]